MNDAFDAQALLIADRDRERQLVPKELVVLAAAIVIAVALIWWHR